MRVWRRLEGVGGVVRLRGGELKRSGKGRGASEKCLFSKKVKLINFAENSRLILSILDS